MRKLTLSIVVGAFGALVACTGETGPQGATGPGGDAGDPGTPGETGAPGVNALTKTSPEAAGTNCASGGVKIETGLDNNNNGTLDTDEVKSTSYVCNTPGVLVKTSDEPAGTNCVLGGTKIESGPDTNGNGTLEATEVKDTSYVCKVAPSGSVSPSTGINVTIKSVTQTGTGPVTVRYLLKDDRGYPLDAKGVYSQNSALVPSFTLAYFTKDATTNIVSPLTVYTQTASASATPVYQPTMYTPTTTGQGTVVENGAGAGDYTYTFPTADVAATTTTGGIKGVNIAAADTGKTHVVWLKITRQLDANYTINANTFWAANQSYYYIPSGTGTPLTREIASQAACDKCHDGFRTETTTSAQFHSGGRVDVGMCNVCHNPGRTSNPLADSASFVHRIHNGENVATANLFHGIAATYPQAIANCDGCHKGAAQASQAQNHVTRLACQGCHDYVKFDGSAGTGTAFFCGGNVGADGKPTVCNHVGGKQTDDASCMGSTCHGNAAHAVAGYHVPVSRPNLVTTGTQTVGYQFHPGAAAQDCTKTACTCSATDFCVPAGANTNIANIAATGVVPSDGAATPKKAAVITYDVKTVTTVKDATDPTISHPSITFKLKKDGTDVVWQTFGGAVKELMPGFIGSPSVYFAWAIPQDGIAKPADFNQSASAYIKNIWNGTITATSTPTAATMTFDAASGYYTVVVLSAKIPTVAVTPSSTDGSTGYSMLTGGLGYTYNWTTTPPLTEVDLAAPYALNSDGASGGLIVPAPNVWKVAVDQAATPKAIAGRRAIVDNAKCNNCHAGLGVEPTFHAGQRNDGPTCSFCHTPNQTSSAWSAGSKYFIHAIHGGRKRSVDFNWHAPAPGQTYGDVEFPNALNNCAACHVPGSYDFETANNLNVVPNFPFTTVGQGVYDTSNATNPNGYFSISPYITSGTNYGSGFGTSNKTSGTYKGVACTQAAPCVCTPAAPCEADDTTLVISPVTTVCSSCHDKKISIDHMKANGGQFYAARSVAKAADGEQCLLCHGPGRVAAIGDVHQR